MVGFIYSTRINRDNAAASLSCMQYFAGKNTDNLSDLLDAMPPESLAPLSSFVFNTDPNRFLPNSLEATYLSSGLQDHSRLLAGIVRGETPHPPTPKSNPRPTRWRSPVYTSTNDLELHNLIGSHFTSDFSKVFTNCYGRTRGQPPFLTSTIRR
jgi:spatacsin